MADKKPQTQRDIAAARQKKSSGAMMTIYNKAKQAIPVQLKAPKGVDFYRGEQTVWLGVGRSDKFPISRLYKDQIINQQKAGRLLVISGTFDA
jgi:hypothetical protein